MTYIAAFGCKDGIIMCADTQESVEGAKNYVEKLAIVEDSSYPLAVGGAGFGSLIDCLIDEIIARATKEQPATKKDLKKLVQQALTEVYKSDLPALTLQRLDHAPQLLVAAYTSEGMCIYPTLGRRVMKEASRAIIGYSTTYNANLLRRLHQPSLPMQQAVMLAVYLVSQSKLLDEGVGLDTRVAIVRDNGAWIDDPVYVKDAEARVGDFLALTDRMFLTCIDVSIPPSEYREQFTQIANGIDVLRHQYLHYAAARTLERALTDPTYRGDPYSKVFPSAVTEVPESGPIRVRENTPKEIERLKQMFHAAKQGYNEQAGKLLHRLLTGREVAFLGNETVTIQGIAGPVDDPSTIS